MTEPARLFTASDVARQLGVNRKWVHNRLRHDGAPREEFVASVMGGQPTLLWSMQGLRRWEAYYSSLGHKPAKVDGFSDHRAVNRVGSIAVTWRLWWRCAYDGDAVWWFSTPQGWWVSDDDARTWRSAECMVRPSDYHYFPVNESANPSPALSAVIRSATKLRRRMESDNTVDNSADGR